MSQRCVILGGGGHASVVIDCLRASGSAAIFGILDLDARRWGQLVLDVPVLGGDELIATLPAQGVTAFVVGFGGIGDNRHRARLFELGLAHGMRPIDVIHPTAVRSPFATSGPGLQLMPGSIVNARAVLGTSVLINSGAIVEHDCIVGDHAHIATGAVLASTVHVGDRAHVGAGATVRQGVSIGDDAIVGAGAVVIRDVPARTVVAGVPATHLRNVEAKSQ